MRLMKVLLAFAASNSLFSMGCCSPCYEPACWEGFCASGFVGGGWKKDHAKFTNPNYFNTLGATLIGSSFEIGSESGLIGGGALGYNAQFNYWVIGAEGGGFLMNLDRKIESPFFPDLDTFEAKLSSLAFIRLRTGIAVYNLFPFITGGWSGSYVNMDFEDIVFGVDAHTGSKWANGWTLGAGCSYKATERFAFGIQYDYYKFYFRDKGVDCPNCGQGVGFGSPDVKSRIPTQTLTIRFDVYI